MKYLSLLFFVTFAFVVIGEQHVAQTIQSANPEPYYMIKNVNGSSKPINTLKNKIILLMKFFFQIKFPMILDWGNEASTSIIST